VRRRIRLVAAGALVLVGIGCAGPPSGPAPAPADAVSGPGSPLPGMIGVAVRADGHRVVVSEVGEPARSAGIEVGDVVVALNGVQITGKLKFERLVLDSPPGSRASLQVLRNGVLRVIEVPVTQVRTGNRA